MMATSGLASRIHACDFSNPENTRFQYGSSVLPLSSAAPMAGTCDEPIPAMILATASLPLCWSGFGLGFRLCAGGFPRRRRLGDEFRRRVLSRPRAVAIDRAAAAEHHLGVIVLRVASHDRGEVLERMPVGRAELGGEIDVAAKLEHAVVVALEDRLDLRRRELELLEVPRLIGLEGPAVIFLHQRHAEHVDAEALARELRVEPDLFGYVVVRLLFARHRRAPGWPHI